MIEPSGAVRVQPYEHPDVARVERLALRLSASVWPDGDLYCVLLTFTRTWLRHELHRYQDDDAAEAAFVRAMTR